MIGVDMASSPFTPLSIYVAYKRREGKEEQSKIKPRKRKKLVPKSVIPDSPSQLLLERILDQTGNAEKVWRNSVDSVANSLEVKLDKCSHISNLIYLGFRDFLNFTDYMFVFICFASVNLMCSTLIRYFDYIKFCNLLFKISMHWLFIHVYNSLLSTSVCNSWN